MRLEKNLALSSLLSLSLFITAAGAAEELKVITTTPDLASIVQELGGDRVDVKALASSVQNPHFVDAKPSMIIKLMKADLLIQTGMDLEIGWVPLLIQSSGNKKIQVGASGFLDTSRAITPLEVPQNVSRAMGDVHPGGNPHYLLDPKNGKLVASLISDKLCELSPKNSELFKKNCATFQSRLDEKINVWLKEMEPYRGTKFVSYHKVYPYFAQRFGLVSIGEIEPKPGIPPTASHTASLIERMKSERVKLILTEPWDESRTPESIGRNTGAKVIVMSLFPGTVSQAKNYIEAIDYNVTLVIETLSPK